MSKKKDKNITKSADLVKNFEAVHHALGGLSVVDKKRVIRAAQVMNGLKAPYSRTERGRS